MAWCGKVGQGMSRSGVAGLGGASRGEERQGKAKKYISKFINYSCRGKSGNGVARLGGERQGSVRQGWARQ